jgi:hypothetical protein
MQTARVADLGCKQRKHRGSNGADVGCVLDHVAFATVPHAVGRSIRPRGNDGQATGERFEGREAACIVKGRVNQGVCRGIEAGHEGDLARELDEMPDPQLLGLPAVFCDRTFAGHDQPNGMVVVDRFGERPEHNLHAFELKIVRHRQK